MLACVGYMHVHYFKKNYKKHPRTQINGFLFSYNIRKVLKIQWP